MIQRLTLCIVALGLSLGSSSGVAHAQTDSDSVKHVRNCRLAGQVIETGHPSPHKEWAWQYISFCEPERRVTAYKSAMLQARVSDDVAFISRALLPAAGFRDGTLFEEVLSIAGDKTATVPSRVVAFMALASMRNPRISPSYEGFIGGLDEYGAPQGGCSRRLAHERPYSPGPTALPSDFVDRIKAVAARVGDDMTEPKDVRSAAACS